LYLSSNQLTTLPESICNLPETCTIFLYNNQICSTIPSCMYWINEQDCGDINCPENLVEINEDCYYQTDLDVLQDIIDVNESLNGKEPLILGTQSWGSGRLYLFSLSDNNLTTLPESFGNLSSLKELYLEYNQLTSIPESIGNLSSLEKLMLDSNTQLTGEIPSWIGNLETLTHLGLSNNQLTGQIPVEIGNLTNLISLNLHSTQLTSIPESIGNLSSLEKLYLNHNQLTSIPESICNLPSDCDIDVRYNQLCEEYHYDCIDEWGTQDCGD
jgi:Leucine-rich repeat (LRR) protein